MTTTAPGAQAMTKRHPLRRAAGVLLTLAVLAALALAAAVAVVPLLAGARTYTVLSPSMTPTFPVGTVVVSRPRPAAEIGAGDVITFADRDPGTGESRVVTHRVVGVEPGPAFRTKGDANEDPDPRPVAAADVLGVEWYSVPWVGGLRDRLVSPAGAAVLGGLVLLAVGITVLVPRPTGPTPAAPPSGPGPRKGRHRDR